MKWLIWKEYRLNRLILILGALLLIAPYAVFAVAFWRDHGLDVSWKFVHALVRDASPLSMVLSQFTLCLLGGHAIACERADRSAEFLAYLPVSRSRILAGKITLSLLCLALIWVPNLILLYTFLVLEPSTSIKGFWEMLAIIASTGFVFFSVA